MPNAVDTPTQKVLEALLAGTRLPKRACLHILLVLEHVDRHGTRQAVVVVRFISDDI
jgi:hypothetical protein